MKKIITKVQPFTMQQRVYVYDDENVVDFVETNFENFDGSILALAEKYNITEVELVGAKFAQWIGERLAKAELNKYNTSNLKIKYL